jgi:putative component of membrane protein insertase Oxa1/YidC/SpoIIIJ protein YidD
MILSIEKYGSLKGILNGIARLLRCRKPNGGIDYP